MSKYIIELDDRIKLVTSVGVTENGVVYTTSDYVHNLEELNSDYINEHFGDLQDTAYDKGYAKCQDDYGDALKHAKDTAYQKGLEDGKAVNDKGCEGCKYANVAGTHEPCVRCSNSYPNQWTAKADKIEVGDEVTHKSDSITWTAVVTQNDNGMLTLMGRTGAIADDYNEKCFVKTGRHFDIQSILEDMRHD